MNKVVRHKNRNVFRAMLLSPPVIVCVFGGAGGAVNLLKYSSWSSAHAIYLLGLICFSLGFYYVRLLISAPTCNRPSEEIPKSKSIILRAYWILSLFALIVSLYIFIERGSPGSGSIFYNLRYAHTIEMEHSLFVEHLSLFPFVLAVYYVYKKRLSVSIIALAISLLGDLVLVQRTGILLKITAFGYVAIWVGVIGVRGLSFALLVFLTLSLFFAYGSGKMYALDGELFIFSYIGYGLSAYNEWVQGAGPVRCYAPVFGNVVGGLIDKATGLHQCGTFRGAPLGEFNVYTYMARPYLVFGPSGVFLIMGVLGMVYGWLYLMARRRGGMFVLLLGAGVYPLVMVFYDWQFNLSTYYYLFILIFPLFVRLKSQDLRSLGREGDDVN